MLTIKTDKIELTIKDEATIKAVLECITLSSLSLPASEVQQAAIAEQQVEPVKATSKPTVYIGVRFIGSDGSKLLVLAASAEKDSKAHKRALSEVRRFYGGESAMVVSLTEAQVNRDVGHGWKVKVVEKLPRC